MGTPSSDAALRNALIKAEAEQEKMAYTMAAAAAEIDTVNSSLNSTLGEDEENADAAGTAAGAEEKMPADESRLAVVEEDVESDSQKANTAADSAAPQLVEDAIDAAAVKIQSIARRKNETTRHKQREDQTKAAVKIQSIARGKSERTRHRERETTKPGEKAETEADGVASKSVDDTKDLDAAAVKIQSIARGKSERKRHGEREDQKRAVVKIESVARGKSERKRHRERVATKPGQKGTTEVADAAPQGVEDCLADHKKKAWDLLGKGDYSAALQHITDSINLSPQSIEVYASRAVAYLQAGNVAAAIADLEECIRLNPNDPKTVVRLANLLMGKGDVQRAQGIIRQGLALHPANAQLQGLLVEHSGSTQMSPVRSPGGGKEGAHPTDSSLTWHSGERLQSLSYTSLPRYIHTYIHAHTCITR